MTIGQRARQTGAHLGAWWAYSLHWHAWHGQLRAGWR